jgi:hypothetical protein
MKNWTKFGSDNGRQLFEKNEKLSKRLQSAKVVKLCERFKFQSGKLPN